MIDLAFGRSAEASGVIEGRGVRLRPPALQDFEEWRALREESRAHLTQWEPSWSAREATRDWFRNRLKLMERDRRDGAALPLFIARRSDGRLVGGVTLSRIRRDAIRSASIGYWVGERHLGKGYATAAVAAALAHAVDQLTLNRIEAAVQPGNEPSLRLLARCGFRQEGLARDYLFINGAWRDHLLFAATARDLRGAPPAGGES
jgi:ribosomal-protein-alanine N-acetyltransferase